MSSAFYVLALGMTLRNTNRAPACRVLWQKKQIEQNNYNSNEYYMELDHKEGWAPKNWCFWIVVPEKILESSLDSKKIKSVNPKGNQSWIFTGSTDDEAEAPILWLLDAKSWLTGRDPDAGKDQRQKKRVAEEDIVRSYHQLNGCESEQSLGDSERCCSPWGCKETQLSDWTTTITQFMVLWKEWWEDCLVWRGQRRSNTWDRGK